MNERCLGIVLLDPFDLCELVLHSGHSLTLTSEIKRVVNSKTYSQRSKQVDYAWAQQRQLFNAGVASETSARLLHGVPTSGVVEAR